jgi:hypothetical protein
MMTQVKPVIYFQTLDMTFYLHWASDFGPNWLPARTPCVINKKMGLGANPRP